MVLLRENDDQSLVLKLMAEIDVLRQVWYGPNNKCNRVDGEAWMVGVFRQSL